MAEQVMESVVIEGVAPTQIVWDVDGDAVYLNVRGWVRVDTLEQLLQEIKSRV